MPHSFPTRRSSALPPCASIAMSSRSLILTSPFSYLHLDYDHTINCQAPSRAESPRTDRSCFGHCHLLDYDYHLSGRRPERAARGKRKEATDGKARDRRDRKSVGEGKRVSVRVDLGGRRSIKKKKNNT